MDKVDTIQQPATAKPRRLSRRRFLKILGASAAGLVGASGLTGLYAWQIEPHWIQIVRCDLPIANLPNSLTGRSLAVISDLHVGGAVDRDYLAGAVDRVNELKPDILAMLGDFMSCVADEWVSDVVTLVDRLDRPALGIVAVLGNHDYGQGWRSPATADRLTDGLRSLGVTVLRNEILDVAGLKVVGLDDLWAHDPTVVPPGELPAGGDYDMPRAEHRFTGPGRFFHPHNVLPQLGRDAPAVVLVHNPDAVAVGDWAGYRGWVLAGHTHGGQVDIPLLGPPMLPVRDSRFIEGQIDLGDGRQLYINRGIGYLKRVRLCSRPEITLFALKRGGPVGR